MPINLRHIEVFRAVMLTGTISGAAELLFVSQPAVSRVLAHTEQTAGFPLFERIKGRLHATPEAKQLFLEVESAYLGVQRVNTMVRDLASNRRGSLRVVSHCTIGGSVVPRAIGKFRQAHPEVRMAFECVRQSALKERMLNQQADLGITLFPVEHPSLQTAHLCPAAIVCVLPPGHPLLRHAVLATSDLLRLPLIGYEPGSPFELLMSRLFDQDKLPESAGIEAGTPPDACALVQAGAGAAIVDEFSARDHDGTGRFTRRLVDVQPLQAVIVHKRYEPMSRISRAFVSVLRGLTNCPAPALSA